MSEQLWYLTHGAECCQEKHGKVAILDASGNFLYPWDLDKIASNFHFHDQVSQWLVPTSEFLLCGKLPVSSSLLHLKGNWFSTRNLVIHSWKGSAYLRVAYQGRFRTSSRHLYEEFIYWLLKDKGSCQTSASQRSEKTTFFSP